MVYLRRIKQFMNVAQQEILTHSKELFLTHGFKSVTMDDISSELGMSKKTLYSHFKNKETLVDAVSMNIYDSICHGIDHICEHSENPIQELYDVKKWVMNVLKGDKTSPIYQLQKYYPKTHRKIQMMQFDFMQNCINANIERGVSQGLYRDNLDVGFISRIYFVGIQGIKDLQLFPSDQFPVMDLYTQYLEYHIRGIVTPSGRKILNEIINSNHD